MYVGVWSSRIKNHIQIRWAKNYELFTNVVIIEIKLIYINQAFEEQKTLNQSKGKKVSISSILKDCSYCDANYQYETYICFFLRKPKFDKSTFFDN